jgi:hypothetical protein
MGAKELSLEKTSSGAGREKDLLAPDDPLLFISASGVAAGLYFQQSQGAMMPVVERVGAKGHRRYDSMRLK